MQLKHSSHVLVIGAFISWGLLPLFWRNLSHAEPMVVLIARTIVSMLLLLTVLMYAGQLQQLRGLLTRRRTLASLALSSMFLMLNWFSYLWAINSNQVLASSIAYFISPILTVLLGVVLGGEKLSHRQWPAAALVVAGVIIRSLLLGAIPWLALIIGASFSAYILVRKESGLNSQLGLFCELVAMCIPTISFGLHQQPQLFQAVLQVGPMEQLLLVLAGVVTVLPMYCFLRGAEHLPLKVVGPLQYLVPTLMLFLAALVFKEPLGLADAYSLPLIWLGVALFMYHDRRA